MKKIFLVILAAFAAITAQGQSTNDALLFSQYNFGLSTARSAAMGGAFTSLGADASSLTINPAGLAMYSASEITLSPGLKIGSTRSRNYDFDGTTASDLNRSMSRVTVNNFAAVFATGEWAIGLAYNRVADFNGISYTEGGFGTQSMADIFVNQLQGTRTGSIGTDSPGYGFNHPPVMWPAILGYQNYVVNPNVEDPNNTGYNLDGILNAGDQMMSTYGTTTTGGIDEFAFSGAYNHNNILYFGATLGVQSIYRTENALYREYALLSDNPSNSNSGALNYFDVGTRTSMSGYGINIKLGVTVRPVSWLRIGVAYHSPTWITMRESTVMDMASELSTTDGGVASFYNYTPDLVQDYNMSTPSRLLAGISFTIAKKVIIALDYERAWYNQMKYTTPINVDGWRAPTSPTYIDCLPNFSDYTYTNGNIDLSAMMSNYYRPVNTVRVGIEARPTNTLFLRAGFAYSQSPYKDIAVSDPNPIRVNRSYKLSDFGDYMQFSGGVGYKRGHFKVDLAYIYGKTSSLPSTFFNYTSAANHNIQSDYIEHKTTQNHNIILSFGWRF